MIEPKNWPLNWVTITEDSNILLVRGSERYLYKPGAAEQLHPATPAGVSFNQDGSITFVTPSARQIVAQPMIQDFDALRAALEKQGFFRIFVTAEGNIIAEGEDENRAMRPGIASLPVSVPEGLYETPSVHGKEPWYNLVFTGSDGVARAQALFPAAPESDALREFLEATPGISNVVFSKNGIIELIQDGVAVRATLIYDIVELPFATGNLQVEPAGDTDGDGIQDYLVLYGNGWRQFVLRLP